ncbi:MAG: PAS domain-containing protein [Croceibacterium sp.]
MGRDAEQGPDEDAIEALVDSIHLSPIATVITDPRQPDNPIVEANPAFTELTGYARDEILGRNCRFLAGSGTEPEARERLRDAVRASRAALVEITNYRKDGDAFRNAVMIAPLFGEDGKVLLFLGSQMDVGSAPPVPDRGGEAERLTHALSPRQRQVLAGMVAGLRNKQIAAELGIDETTVKMHRRSMLSRLGASTTADAIRIGVEAGLAR